MKKFFSNPLNIVLILFGIGIVITTAQGIFLENCYIGDSKIKYTHYNNYLIFKQSFFHLIHNKDLYLLFPYEYNDVYKYSPTFPVFMSFMAVLPDFAGLLIWNSLNVFILLFAIWKLPVLSDKKKIFVFALIFIEMLTSLRNSQSNGLITGLIVLGFVFLEQKKIAWASLLIVSTIFIKLFGIVALSLFVLYPNKLKSIGWIVCWMILFTLLPLVFISFSQLTFLYHGWYNVLQMDHSVSYGLSVFGWLYSWFNIESNSIILLIGVIVFCLPLIKFSLYSDLKFKLLFLASILSWMVIFNHKAESPTFIIAITGMALWFVSQKPGLVNILLLDLAIAFTIFSSSDIYPGRIRYFLIEPYVLKAVPCILIWVKIIYDLMLIKKPGSLESESALIG